MRQAGPAVRQQPINRDDIARILHTLADRHSEAADLHHRAAKQVKTPRRRGQYAAAYEEAGLLAVHIIALVAAAGRLTTDHLAELIGTATQRGRVVDTIQRLVRARLLDHVAITTFEVPADSVPRRRRSKRC